MQSPLSSHPACAEAPPSTLRTSEEDLMGTLQDMAPVESSYQKVINGEADSDDEEEENKL